MQWLRSVPEAEPPAELRRRIGTALLEVERAAGRKRFGFTFPPLPRTAGWAWGAALGTAAATVFLLVSHQPTLVKQMAATPPSRAMAITPTLRASLPPPAANRPHQPAAAVQPTQKPKQALPAAIVPRPRTEPIMPPERPLAVSVPRSVALAASATSLRLEMKRPAPSHVIPVKRPKTRPSLAHPMRPALRTGPGGGGSPARLDSSGDGAALVARGGTASPGATSNDETANDESQAAIDSMTQMASGDASVSTSETASDDLSELRQRLTDRQPPLPQLGALKSTGTPRAVQNGWIRF